ncbi:MAG TPA: NHL repeat-containing protein [Acidobacteriaceae bacterium]|nr:NHL repeat-containing protein [Acidobacteriaceae bacterium]
MQKLHWVVAFLLLPASFAAASLLIACGSSPDAVSSAGANGSNPSAPPPAQQLAVADSENNRILIFDAPFVTDENASVVLGQPDFTQQEPNQGGGPADNTVASPQGLATDAAGNLYVADSENCRVLQFRPPFTTNMNASLILGEPPQGGGSCATGPSAVDTPASVVVDAHGDLWVVEANRAAEYVPPFSNGMSPSVVLGQTSASGDPCNAEGAASNGSNPPLSAATLCNPVGAALDSHGDFWVADGLNGRVLEYAPPFSTGMAATLELGVTGAQPFTSPGCTTSESAAAKLCFPQALAFDSAGDLWVTTAFSGIFEFAPPFASGMASQMNFAQPPAGANDLPSAGTTTIPYGIFQSRNGNLLVSDSGDNRVLIFAPPFGPGMQATMVIGQPNMTTGTDSAGAAANKLWYPVGVLTF